jgi:hypothetical protein
MADLERSERTPETEAVITTAWVWKWFDDHPTAFGVEVDCARFRAELDAAQAEGTWTEPESAIGDIHDNEGGFHPFAAFVAAVLCAAAAQRLWEEGRANEAWSYALDGKYWGCRAMYEVTMLESAGPIATVADFARLGAAARHAENRAMKQDAIEAYQKGDFASKDAAAEYIAGTLVPVKFRTVRDWLKGISKP